MDERSVAVPPKRPACRLVLEVGSRGFRVGFKRRTNAPQSSPNQDYYRDRGPKEGGPNWGPPGRGHGREPGGLPPGIERRLERGKPIPAGLQRDRLPQELEEHLGRLPEGYVHLRVGGSIVIEHVRTGVVVDIIHDIGG